MLTSNPAPGFRDHPDKTITIEPSAGHVRVVSKDGVVLASSARAKSLAEDGYSPVLYIPFEDINMQLLSRTATRTHCPFKGDATYWHVGLPGDVGKDVMWTYETPYDEMAEIKDHGAFIADRVRIETR